MNKNNYNFYWGILHCHIKGDLCHYLDTFSEKMLAEARSQIAALHKFVRDEMKYDFLSYADHHNMGKMIELGRTENSPWNLMLDAWNEYNEAGKFITILGYEYQDGIGEYNIYLNRSDMTPVGSVIDEVIASVKTGEHGVIFAAHNRPFPTDWTFARHENFRMVEIINDGGMPFEEWALKGLEAGHKVGFIGGSDDHSCTPGKNSSTCVLASELSRKAVWNALEARRTVATTGIRPEISFELNDAQMGSEIECNGKRVLRMTHKFEECPEWVGIIKNGRLLNYHHPKRTEFSFSFKDNEAERAVDYYYLKIIYSDGNYAFASPIWVSTDNTGKYRASKNNDIKGVGPPHYELEKEFGERVGRSKWFNASSLPSEKIHGFSKKFRDMVCHLGPDPMLALADNSLVYPTMDAIMHSAPDGSGAEMIYPFGSDDESLVLTSLCDIGPTLQASGYLDGNPVVRNLRGAALNIFKDVLPVNQFFYESEFVSPSWLASDGRFFCVLCEREGGLFTQEGKAIGYFQDGYPAFPVAVRMRSIDEIYVLDFAGCLTCYSFAAATTGRLMWEKSLDNPALSLALTQNGVLIYNGTTKNHNKKTVTVHRIFSDGSDGGAFDLDLMNRRGTSIVELADGRLAAMHNSSMMVAAIYREQLNETGKIRAFKNI